ncbi:54S ribosomal protein L4 mitochondrial [Ascosphaera acerosa]|nr:54S ribosomal protein L4 mitochondrial [Ascosphaera acerosa]
MSRTAQSGSGLVAGLARAAALAPPPPMPLLLRTTAPVVRCTAASRCQQSSHFSTSPAARARNKRRGVSAIHRTGLNVPLHASKFELPKPAPREQVEKAIETSPDHGLWGFFVSSKELVPTPEYETQFGRPWTIQELRAKSFDDLHCLWWICAKERNRIATSSIERNRLALGYGAYEANERKKTVLKTQKAIKAVLTERWYAWQEARDLVADGGRPDTEGFYEK